MAAGIQTGAKYTLIGGPRETRPWIIANFDLPATAVLLNTNEEPNPGFYIDNAGYTGETVTRNGGGPVEFISKFFGKVGPVSKTDNDVSVFTPYTSADPGNKISASILIDVMQALTSTHKINVEFRNGADTLMGTAQGTVVAAGTGLRTAIIENAVAPAGTTKYRLRLVTSAVGTQTSEYRFGNVVRVKSATLPDTGNNGYFDGNTHKAKWTGTVGASTSLLYDRSVLEENWVCVTGCSSIKILNQDVVVPTATGEKRWIYNKPIGDQRNFDIIMKFKTMNPIEQQTGIILHGPVAGQYLLFRTVDGLEIRSDSVGISGGYTVGAAFTMAAGTVYYFRAIKEGNRVWAELYVNDPAEGYLPVVATTPTEFPANVVAAIDNVDLIPGFRWTGTMTGLNGEIQEFRINGRTITNPTFETDPHSYPGTRAVLNDDQDVDYVGITGGEDAVTGLDSAEVAESFDDNVESDGSVHGAFFERRRPITLTAQVPPGDAATRNKRAGRFISATRALRQGDMSAHEGILIWQPAGYPEMFVPYRRQQPTREGGLHIKTLGASLVSEGPRIYGVKLNDTGEVTPSVNAAPATTFDRAGNQITPPFTGNSAALVASVANAGDGVAPVIIRFRAVGQTPFAIQNGTTGEEIRIDGTAIGSGEVMVIEPVRRRVYMEATGVNLMDRVDIPKTRWWGLVPGTNDIRVALPSGGWGGGGFVQIIWRDVWS